VASLVMTVTGPSRSVALGLNFALVAIWLGTTAYAIRRLFGAAASLVVLGLLLSTGILAYEPGGPLDFRLDFAAACLWGTLLALIAMANGGEGWGVRVAIIVTGICLIVTRFISSFYLLPFGGLVTLALLTTRWRYETSWRRWVSWMMIAVGVWGVIFAVILVGNYESFANYYVRGHVTGEERVVRRMVEGLVSLSDDLAYYPERLIGNHLEQMFRYLAGLVLIVAGAAGAQALWEHGHSFAALKDKPDRPGGKTGAARMSALPEGGVRPLPWFLGMVALGLLVVYGTLTAAQVKNPAVANMLVAPTVLLVVGAALTLSRIRWADPASRARPLFLALGVVAVGAGLVNQWQHARTGPVNTPPLATLQAYNQILDDAAPVFAEASSRPITWSIDGHYVEISAPTILVLTYERTGRWLELRNGLGHGPVEQSLDAAALLREAEASDLLLLSRRPPGTRLSYPYDQSVQDQHEILDRYAEERLTLLGSYTIAGTPYRLFGRPVP
jgi:hypothetical protein